MGKRVNISLIKPNEENPRFITEQKFKKLVKSIKEAEIKSIKDNEDNENDEKDDIDNEEYEEPYIEIEDTENNFKNHVKDIENYIKNSCKKKLVVTII